MTGPEGVPMFPVLKGLRPGDVVVTSGSFLVDAETRLNPAAGSIYFGGSGGSSSASAAPATVRPSTPEEEAGITEALGKLPPADREAARRQRFCVVETENRLGSMGPPVKVTIEGQAVFLCCEGCRQEALEQPQRTLQRWKQFTAATAPAKEKTK
jgi:hypothetical protein